MAASRKKRNWQRRYRGAKQQPRLHRADASTKTFVASIGTVPPAPWPDSPALQTAPLRCRDPQTAAERSRFVPTAANRRDRPQIGRAQRNTGRMSRGSARHEPAISQSDCAGWSRGSARPRPALARDASHGQDTAVGREASPGQDIGNSREHGHFPDATLRWRSISPPGRMSDLTDKTKFDLSSKTWTGKAECLVNV